MSFSITKDNCSHLYVNRISKNIHYSRVIDRKLYQVILVFNTNDELIEILDSLSSMDDNTFELMSNLSKVGWESD